ncbi:hypothetical protein KUTeg_005240 [Tegillarca granosa]|uniref:KANL3/Tex30 alpha/beta hydrolase-like domain-containing protein n=1 Tax=Tegillarca granosa TaxID=220873 RepID=A0ABQ9FMD3_TEGGR|nr:hypothetical protein KUTeg_005240 [Tegillarca granosa]
MMPLDLISMDHGYSKPWSAHPDASNARPVKLLYMTKLPRNQEALSQDVIVDVDSVATSSPPPYDMAKARSLMHECDRHVNFARMEDSSEDWEDRITRTGWTLQQNRLFNKVMKALQADKLARLTYQGSTNEPVMRRIHIDKTARRVRHALASVSWVPSLIDKMIATASVGGKSAAASLEALGLLLKRPWDPVLSVYTQQKLRKLPGNPLLLIAPSGPTHGGNAYSKRTRFWNSQLSNLGKVIPVTMHTVSGGSGVGIAQCLEHMIGAVRTKVLELKGHFQHRPIVLLGWNIGSLVACHVALVENVTAVVCLGFPMMGINGTRGDVEDSLLDSKTPTLFVVGQNSTTSTIDNMEDLRERMKAENGLLVVGGADDNLRLTRAKKKQEGITQVMADKQIMDEVSEFLGGILSQTAHLNSETNDVSDVEQKKKKKRKYERTNISPLSTNRSLAITKAYRTAPRQSTDAALLTGSVLLTQSNPGTSIPSTVLEHDSRSAQKRKQPRSPSANAPRKRVKSAPGVGNAEQVKVPYPVPKSPDIPAGIHAVQSAPELSGLLRGHISGIPHTVIDTETRNLLSKKIGTSTVNTSTNNYTELQKSLKTTNVSGMIMVPTDSIQQQKSSPLSLSSGAVIQQLQQPVKVSSPIATIPMTLSTLSTLRASLKPTVHVTTAASSVTSQIQQLLTGAPKSALTVPSPTQGVTQVSYPKLLSSLASPSSVLSTVSVTMTTVVATKSAGTTLTPSTVSEPKPSSSKSPEEQKVQAIQKLQFHDFPLTTASLVKTSTGNAITQAKILTSSHLNLDNFHLESIPSTNSTAQLGSSLKVTPSVVGSITTVPQPVTMDTAQKLVKSVGSTATKITSTTGNIATVTISMDRTIPRPSITTISKSQAEKTVVMTTSETLGKVSSLLESSPITQKPTLSIVSCSSVSSQTVLAVSKGDNSSPGPSSDTTVSNISGSKHTKSPSSTVTSYTTSAKPVLPTVASTRTRRIRTPKQYDL